MTGARDNATTLYILVNCFISISSEIAPHGLITVQEGGNDEEMIKAVRSDVRRPHLARTAREPVE